VKDTWYSDHRDLVKWGALVHLSRREKIPNIIQVAFLRNGYRPPIEIDGEQCEIAHEVWAHFRDVARIRELADRTGNKIALIDRQFDSQQRTEYIQHVIDVIAQQRAPRIILLDPDTGIEPAKATPEHVKTSDIENIWRSLDVGDWLVLYQHASRRTNWRDETRTKFANACGANGVSTIQAPSIAPDVAFFAAKKNA